MGNYGRLRAPEQPGQRRGGAEESEWYRVGPVRQQVGFEYLLDLAAFEKDYSGPLGAFHQERAFFEHKFDVDLGSNLH